MGTPLGPSPLMTVWLHAVGQSAEHKLCYWLVQKEIEKVKKRREEREIERAQQEEELSMLARERAIAEGYELEKKEDEVRDDTCCICICCTCCI